MNIVKLFKGIILLCECRFICRNVYENSDYSEKMDFS